MRGVILMLVFLLSCSAWADSMLRITCEGADENAEVYINGEFRGECPLDVKVKPGTLEIRATKPFNEDKIRVFKQTLRMGDDGVKKISVTLDGLEWTQEGWKREQERVAVEAARKEQEEKEQQRLAEEHRRATEEAEVKRRAELVALIPQIEFNMVTIPKKNYALGKYEVTQGEWEAVMGDNPSAFHDCGDNCPVERVSWDDIQIFLQKLNAKTGKQYRLPTEEEWEYACYGGQRSLFGSTAYCGSNDVNSVAWYDANSDRMTHPVGQKQPNIYGLYDMSGNVLEWLENCYDSSCAGRVLRGGSWLSKPQNVRAADRDHLDPTYRYYDNGFRLARTLP